MPILDRFDLAGRRALITGGSRGLGLEMARALGGELVGADSVQLYERLVIGSARPTEEELAGVPHHLLGTVGLRDHYDAARYIDDADRAIAEVTARGKVAIVVGGTGLYQRALVKGLALGIPSDAAVRDALRARAAEGPETLAVGRLVLDPYSATLFSSSPQTFARIEALIGEGLSMDEAIERIAFPDNPEKWAANAESDPDVAIAAE